MTELSAFIDAHPMVTFGVFLVALTLADGIGKLFRICIRIGGKDKP